MTRTTDSVNPLNGEIITTYELHSGKQIDEILGQSASAGPEWRARSFSGRAKCLRDAARLLKKRKNALARLMATEMGKPLDQAESEVDKCAWACEYYADNGEAFLSARDIETDAQRSRVVFEPLGNVLAIMPWNFPLWQVFRFAAPTLMAGNTGVLKHAGNVSGCALAIEDVFEEAGFPDGTFRTLLADKEQVGTIIEDPRVHAVTLTGSIGAGRSVASQAGKALKKTVLELGGSDPYLVLADADIADAADTCVASRLINTGQSCIAAKRFIVEKPVLEAFTEAFVARMAEKRSGDPLEEGTDLGPLARADLRDDLHEQVTRSIDAGAECLLGGEVPEGAGAFYPATVLAGVRPGMPAYSEELFGPVAAIIAAEDADDAVRIANDTSFGLGAAIFTSDPMRGEEIAAHRLRAGSAFVNALVKSDPRLPFGGIRNSGYGRELGSFGIREFVNIKTVYVAG